MQEIENEFCKDCRMQKEMKCMMRDNQDMTYEEVFNCSHYYSEDDRKVFSSKDDETESLFEELM
jgi:hypothetical protein